MTAAIGSPGGRQMNAWVAGAKSFGRRFLTLAVAALSPAMGFAADPTEVPSVFSRTIWGYSVTTPDRVTPMYGISCEAACSAAGGGFNFSGCHYPNEPVWWSGCGAHYSPCPPGYRLGTDNPTF